MTGRCVGASVVLGSAAVLLACSSSTSSSRQASLRSPAFVAPLTVATTDHCVRLEGSHPSIGDVLVTVAADPESVDAAWYPGLRTPPCTEPVTHAYGAAARRLADDVRAASPYPPGKYACPADFGESVQLYFRYAGQHSAQTAIVSLTGCSSITAPGRDGMGLEADRILTDLDAMTPPGVRRPST